MIRLLLTLLIAFVPLAKGQLSEAAQTAVLDYPISQLLEKFMSTEDATYIPTLTSRCSALLGLFVGLSAENGLDVGPLEGVSEQMLTVALNVAINNQKGKKGQLDEAEMNEIKQRVGSDFDSYMKVYGERFQSNKLATGDYWSSDEPMVGDITTCRNVASMLSLTNVPYPFDKTVPQLMEEQKSGGGNRSLAREELAMRCGGLLAKLTQQQGADGIAVNQDELAEAGMFGKLFGSLSFQRIYPDRELNEEAFWLHVDEYVGPEVGAKGEVYAKWINSAGLTGATLQDKDHAFTVDYDNCREIGGMMIEASQ